jgi:hypothetical protein
MCEICGRYFCAPECPMFVGSYVGKGRIAGTCEKCGRLIYYSDVYVRESDKLRCAECADCIEKERRSL